MNQEQNIEQTIENLYHAVETMDGGIMTLDKKGLITYANPMACTCLGIKQGEKNTLSDLANDELDRNDPLVDLITESIMKPNTDLTSEIPFCMPDGKKKWIQVNCIRTPSRDTVITFIDRTMLKIQENRLRDSAIILVTIIAVLCLWAALVSLWQFAGKPIGLKEMTILIEAIGLVVMFFILKKTDLKLKNMGLSTKNLKKVLIKDTLISMIAVFVMVSCKLVIMKRVPDFYDPSVPFWDLSGGAIIFIKYMFTAFFQEFISRGAIQSSISRVMPWENSDQFANLITSLFFMALHVQNGFLFSIGSFFLSLLLGYIYTKDRNIYGITIIHYVIGITVECLHLFNR